MTTDTKSALRARIEAAIAAMERAPTKPLWEVECLRLAEIVRKDRSTIIAALTADAADGVRVPREVFDWLMGENGPFVCDPKHYFRSEAPPYWWRAELSRRILAAPTAEGTREGVEGES